MRKLLLLIVLCCIGSGICLEANAKRKRPKIHTYFFEKRREVKNPRSIVQPIFAELTPDGNAITLNSPEDCDRAFVTISGNGEYLTDMMNFANKTATLDVTDLGCGVYQIIVEFENGAIYNGQFEFVE